MPDQMAPNNNPFQALSSTEVLVLDSNKKLWLEHRPFEAVPPTRQQIDSEVASFQALSDTEVFVPGSDNNLFEHGHALNSKQP